MDNIIHFWSIKSIAFSLWKYDVSYIELLGTILSLWSVWLVTKRHILTWPIGIAGTILCMAVFYQSQLYADTIEQVYYVVTGFYGWWLWRQTTSRQEEGALRTSPPRALAATLAVVVLFSALSGWMLTHAHTVFPRLFPEEASYPYPDALTTIMAFAAQLLMTARRIECWVYWILVDVISIWLYTVKKLPAIALLFVILLCMASNGLRVWWLAAKTNRPVS